MPQIKRRFRKIPGLADIAKTVSILNGAEPENGHTSQTEKKVCTDEAIQEYHCKKAANVKLVKKDPSIFLRMIRNAVAEAKIYQIKIGQQIEYRTPKTLTEEEKASLVYYMGDIPGPAYFQILKVGLSMENYNKKSKEGEQGNLGLSPKEWLDRLHQSSRYLNYNLDLFKDNFIKLAVKKGHLQERVVKSGETRYSIKEKFHNAYKMFRRNRKLALQLYNDGEDESADASRYADVDVNSNQSYSDNEDSIDTSQNEDLVNEDSNSQDTTSTNKDLNPSEEKTDLKEPVTSTPTQTPQRVSQRKRTPKSLGPDFVDSSTEMNMLISQQNQSLTKPSSSSSNDKSSSSSSSKNQEQSTSANMCLICRLSFRQKSQITSCSQCRIKVHSNCFRVAVNFSANTQWICTNCRPEGQCLVCHIHERRPDLYLACKFCNCIYHPHCWRDKAKSYCIKCRFEPPIQNNSNVTIVKAAPKVLPISTGLYLKNNLKSTSLLQSNSVGKSLISKPSKLMKINGGSLIQIPSQKQQTSSTVDGKTENASTVKVKEEPIDENHNDTNPLSFNQVSSKSNATSSSSILCNSEEKKESNKNSLSLIVNNKDEQSLKPKKKKRKTSHTVFDIWQKKPSQAICYNFQSWLDTELKHVCKRFGPEIDASLLSSLPNAVTDWTREDVHLFISTLGFKDEAEIFLEKDIDGLTIMLLTRQDFLHALSIRTGPAIRIYGILNRLQEEM